MLCAVRVTLCVSGIVRAVHQSSSKLGDIPLARLVSTSLSHCLPGGSAVEPLQLTLQQNRALHRSTSDSHRPAPDVELYSSTALQSALHLYSSTALYTLHPLHPPSEICPEIFRSHSSQSLKERLEISMTGLQSVKIRVKQLGPIGYAGDSLTYTHA